VVAVSDRTAEAVRDFARAGGTVIADTWCGIMDETCRLREKSALDDLVGVRPNPTVVHSELGGVESRHKDVKGNVFNEPSPAVLNGPDGPWMYDVTEGRSLGRKKAVPFTSEPGAGRLYACWPFEIQGLTAKVRMDGDRILKIEGRVQTSTPARKERLVVSLRVFRPDGSEQPAYRWNIDCRGNEFKHSVPLGVNEDGRWRLELREPCSGLNAIKAFSVR
jgi:hypothetical protein